MHPGGVTDRKTGPPPMGDRESRYLRDTVNERAVCILLECIFILINYYKDKGFGFWLRNSIFQNPNICYIFQLKSWFTFGCIDDSGSVGSTRKSLPDGATGSGNRTLKDAKRGIWGYLKNIYTKIYVACRIWRDNSVATRERLYQCLCLVCEYREWNRKMYKDWIEKFTRRK